MKIQVYLLFILLFFFSCTSKKSIVYLSDVNNNHFSVIAHADSKNNIESGDILNISVQTIVAEAAIPYNKISINKNQSQNLDILKLEGYLVDEFNMINLPVLGKLSVLNQTINQIEKKITQILVDDGHLSNPIVKVRRINSKFTVLGEVKIAGTFNYFDESLNIFQALGYAGDLNINGKRNEITLIREENGLRKVFEISLTKSDIINKPYYNIKNNDIIIVKPNYSKVKSAGFIGSPTSIASLSSLLLSITLLIINK